MSFHRHKRFVVENLHIIKGGCDIQGQLHVHTNVINMTTKDKYRLRLN